MIEKVPEAVVCIYCSNNLFVEYMYVCIVITYSKGKDQPGEVASPARGQLIREN